MTQTINTACLRDMKQAGEKITVLTSYDASMTTHCETAGVEVLLVGDSLGMVLQGHDSTLPVRMDDMVYHTANVARVRQRAMLISDMSYHSYQTVDETLVNARRLIDAGADMVKLEGGEVIIEQLRALAAEGIPVCGHLGLLPQSVNELGGYKVQGREAQAAEQMLADAKLLEETGVDMIVLECIPRQLAKRITESVEIPIIGIGAGPDCDGQVLVIYDLLGLTPGKRPRFTRDYLSIQPEGKGVVDAIKDFVNDVKEKRFPADEHGFD